MQLRGNYEKSRQRNRRSRKCRIHSSGLSPGQPKVYGRPDLLHDGVKHNLGDVSVLIFSAHPRR